MPHPLGQSPVDLVRQARATVDQPGVNLYQARPRLDLFQRRLRPVHASHADDRELPARPAIDGADHLGRPPAQRRTTQPTFLARQWRRPQMVPAHRRVGGDDPVQIARQYRVQHVVDLGVAQVRCDLDQQRQPRPQPVPLVSQVTQQRPQRRPRLQLAQPRRVRRAHVHRHEIRQRVKTGQQLAIVIPRCLEWCVAPFADVHPDPAPNRARQHARQPRVDHLRPRVRKAHSVDDRLVRRQAKNARPWVARLWPRCHRAHLEVPKTERRQLWHHHRILVITRCQADRVRELDAKHLRPQALVAPAVPACQ